MNILEVKNLCVQTTQNGKKLLNKVCFSVEKKSIHAILGPNGSGKSSLAMALMGIERFKISSGKILFNNKDITGLPVYKRAKLGISLAWQNPCFLEGISVEQFIAIGKRNITEKEIDKSLSLVGLDPKKFKKRELSSELSGGERKRIELASVIAMKPRLLILDEPDSGLDMIIYKELHNILRNIKEQTNASILLITHREESGIIADKASFLYQGKIMATGKFRPIMRKYCQTLNRKAICQQFPQVL